jgi:4-hydroxy-4-methyl-2-oxoglutarate aldolase
MTQPITPELMRMLSRLDTCSVANAIEAFDVRLRNSGFADATVRCMFHDLPPVAGYAATARVHTSEPPMEGHTFIDRTEWWLHILSIPEPRIVVVEDSDSRPGLGAFIGELHANILIALGAIAVVTNGAVRDLPAVRALNFPLFARHAAVSHAFAHVFDFGSVVRVGGMEVHAGDIVHGDLHGVQTIPWEIAAKIPARVKETARKERNLIAFCRSRAFSVEKLREVLARHKEVSPRDSSPADS